MTQTSGTLLSASPPRIRLRFTDGRSNMSDDSRAKGSVSIWRKMSKALSTALSPTHGVEPCAALPVTSIRMASTPLAWMPMCMSVGSPVIAKSPDVALLHQVVGAALLEVLGLLVGHAHEMHAHPLLPGQVVQGAHHRRQPALHVVGAATVEAIAVDVRRELLGAAGNDVQVPVQDDRRRPLGGPTVAASSGRPLCTPPVTSTSRASSQPLTKPAALCMPSSVDVS